MKDEDDDEEEEAQRLDHSPADGLVADTHSLELQTASCLHGHCRDPPFHAVCFYMYYPYPSTNYKKSTLPLQAFTSLTAYNYCIYSSGDFAVQIPCPAMYSEIVDVVEDRCWSHYYVNFEAEFGVMKQQYECDLCSMCGGGTLQ